MGMLAGELETRLSSWHDVLTRASTNSFPMYRLGKETLSARRQECCIFSNAIWLHIAKAGQLRSAVLR